MDTGAPDNNHTSERIAVGLIVCTVSSLQPRVSLTHPPEALRVHNDELSCAAEHCHAILVKLSVLTATTASRVCSNSMLCVL